MDIKAILHVPVSRPSTAELMPETVKLRFGRDPETDKTVLEGLSLAVLERDLDGNLVSREGIFLAGADIPETSRTVIEALIARLLALYAANRGYTLKEART